MHTVEALINVPLKITTIGKGALAIWLLGLKLPNYNYLHATHNDVMHAVARASALGPIQRPSIQLYM